MSDDAVTRVSVEIAGTRDLLRDRARWPSRPRGAVVVRQGDTMVLCTATAGNLRDVDFLPLTVDVEERMYAAGKIPGSFFKREGRAGEKAHADRAHDRPPAAPALPQGLALRDAARRDPAVDRPRAPRTTSSR